MITRIASRFTLLNNFVEVHLDPTRTFCPRSSCDGVCQISSAKRHGRRMHAATGPRPVVCSSVSVVDCHNSSVFINECLIGLVVTAVITSVMLLCVSPFSNRVTIASHSGQLSFLLTVRWEMSTNHGAVAVLCYQDLTASQFTTDSVVISSIHQWAQWPKEGRFAPCLHSSFPLPVPFTRT